MNEKNEYTTMCDTCYKKTWYPDGEGGHYSCPDTKTCNRGHVHINEPHHEKRCTGTLRAIDYTNVRTHLTIGERYTFRDKNGIVKRFRLGKTTGWRPCLLLLHNARSTGSSITVNAPDLVYRDGAYDTGTYFV